MLYKPSAAHCLLWLFLCSPSKDLARPRAVAPVPPWEVPLPARLEPGSIQDLGVNSVLVWACLENVRVLLKRLDAPVIFSCSV